MRNPNDTGATGRRAVGAEIIDELENLEITTVVGEDYGIEDYVGDDSEPGEQIDDIEAWLELNS